LCAKGLLSLPFQLMFSYRCISAIHISVAIRRQICRLSPKHIPAKR
jgi:hypothetical protein